MLRESVEINFKRIIYVTSNNVYFFTGLEKAARILTRIYDF